MAKSERRFAMSTHEGGVVRIELESLLQALDHFDEEAARCEDLPVHELLSHLHAARKVAKDIEMRGKIIEQPTGEGH